MSQQTQKENFRVWAKTRLIEMDVTIEKLAQRIGHPRPSVSHCINRGGFPRIKEKVIAELAE